MTIDPQQVSPQDLQRLNDAILVTMESLRRVAPHLAQGYGQIGGGQMGLPFGGVPGMGPIGGMPGMAPGVGTPGMSAFGGTPGMGGLGAAPGMGMGTVGAMGVPGHLADPVTAAYMHGQLHALRAMAAHGLFGMSAAPYYYTGGYGAMPTTGFGATPGYPWHATWGMTPFGVGTSTFGYPGYGYGAGTTTYGAPSQMGTPWTAQAGYGASPFINLQRGF